MPRLSISFLLSLAFIPLLSGALNAEIKAFTVNMNLLFNKYHVTKTNMDGLKAARDSYLKEREERKKSLTDVAQKIQALMTKLRSKAMPKAEKQNVISEYEELVSQYNALNKDLRESDREKLDEIRAKIAKARRSGLNEITEVVVKFAKDNSYQWVMENSGFTNTQMSPLLYARNAEDKTEEILAILNKDAPKEEKAEENEE